jgi:hypothetical protein
MSYCRWSTDDFQCDLYCFEHTYGWYQTYVAGNRIEFAEPLPEPVPFTKETFDEWWKRYKVVEKIIQKSKKVPIGLPYDGQGFRDKTPQEFLSRLLTLKAAGYRFPDEVIEQIKEEIKEKH